MFEGYRGASAALATMHGKAAAIAPPMQLQLGLDVITPSDVDTDALGTFTGEIRRVGSMRDVAIRKARLGMRASGLRLGIASEGSIGPHPAIPFFRVGIEVMVLVDDLRGLIIAESLIAEETTYDEIVVASVSELEPFLERSGFPEHALVVAPNLTASPWWKLHPEKARPRKGVMEYDELIEAVDRALRISEDRRARVVTDLRAHMNPTRMKAIARLATLLAARIASECPRCHAPGFARVAPAGGLPCRVCGKASIVPRGDILRCVACTEEVEDSQLPINASADPAECPHCNP